MHEEHGDHARPASRDGRRDPCEEVNAVDWKRAREAARLAGLSECLVTDAVVERYAALTRDVRRTRGVRGTPMRPEERIAAAILIGLNRSGGDSDARRSEREPWE